MGEIEDAEGTEAVAATEITKTPVVISARTWTISNLNTLDMDIESAIRIIETREDIREAVAVAVEEVEAIAEILAETTVRITVKVMVRITIISSRNIPARETRMEVTIGAAGTIIRTGGKAEEEGAAEFKVDGIKVPIIPVRIIINAAATTGAEADSTEEATLHMFVTIGKVFHKEKKKKKL